MRKKKKGRKVPAAPDPRLAGDKPTANSAEFVPSIDPALLDPGAYDTADTFDFIPDLKGSKFS